MRVFYHLSLFAITCALITIGCVSNTTRSTTGTWHIVDSLILHHPDAGLTLYGPRLIERNGTRRIYLLDDAHLYLEFDVKTGARTDSLNLAPTLDLLGFDEDAGFTGIVWIKNRIAVLTAIYPRPCFVVVDVEQDSAWTVEHNADMDRKHRLWAYSTHSAEQRVVGTNVISAVQPFVAGLNSNDSIRRIKYSYPPVALFAFDSTYSRVRATPIGTFPDYYQEFLVRIADCSFDVRDSLVALSFFTSPDLLLYNAVTGVKIESTLQRLPFDVKPRPYENGSDTPFEVGRFYYESSRTPIVRFFGRDSYLRTYIPGLSMGSDTIIPREHNVMDWKIVVQSISQGASRQFNIPGERMVNTFLETIDDDVLLQASTSPDGTTILYRCVLEP